MKPRVIAEPLSIGEVRLLEAVFTQQTEQGIRLDPNLGGGALFDMGIYCINAARYPLFCGVDADSILQRDSLERVTQPFLRDPTVVATGGTIRIANGCEVAGGFLTPAILDGMGTPPDARADAIIYLRVLFAAMPSVYFFNFVMMAQRGGIPTPEQRAAAAIAVREARQNARARGSASHYGIGDGPAGPCVHGPQAGKDCWD